MPDHIDLNGTWKLRWEPINATQDVPCCASAIDACVPGDVHVDLVRAGVLPEPLVGDNCSKHDWIEQAVFTYERDLAIGDRRFARAELVFDGLDCHAEVFVDGQRVGVSRNALVPHVFDVSNSVRPGGIHKLSVRVETGVQWAKTQMDPKYKRSICERMFLRKAHFAFGWDWAPRLVNCGIWRDVSLRLHERAALRDVALTSSFGSDGATLTARSSIECFDAGEYSLAIAVRRGSHVWETNMRQALRPGTSVLELALDVAPVERWYPNGLGEQALYEVEVDLLRDGQTVDSYGTSYGFRQIEVKQEPLGNGQEGFTVCANGMDVFCKGANWVPADSLYTRVGFDKYQSLIEDAVEANFNMLRVWGGGIYEADVFYDLCDRNGLMLWHDFMFAGSEFPDDQQWFADLVEDEAGEVVKRLRHHPCIALWCGNNEIDWHQGNARRRDGDPDGRFCGYDIFHRILPGAVAEYDPQRMYWPSSPFGGDCPNSEERGDRHSWDVSILIPDVLERADIRNYRRERGKFISEYGVLSCAPERTILDYTHSDSLDLTTEACKFHDNPFNNQHSLTDWYLKVGFGSIPEDPRDYVAQSLAYQAMGYREAISDFRIRMPDCSGSLLWMYSDCWGTLGWTVIDYYLRRKPSYYWVKKAYAPLASFVRVEGDTARTYVVNDHRQAISLQLDLEVGDMNGRSRQTELSLVAAPNAVTVGPEMECGAGYARARILREHKVVYEDLILTRLPSEMVVPPAVIGHTITETDEHLIVTVESDGFGHLVELVLPDGAWASDNYFNLIGGAPKRVIVTGANADDIALTALNSQREPRPWEPDGLQAVGGLQP